MRLSADRSAGAGIELVRGGAMLLGPRAVSLHLYGRAMTSFNTCDDAAGTWRRVELAHNES